MVDILKKKTSEFSEVMVKHIPHCFTVVNLVMHDNETRLFREVKLVIREGEQIFKLAMQT